MGKTADARANLFIAGAPKCGTTAWHAYLGTHPDIFFSEMKEPNYFAFDLPKMRRTITEQQYDRLFERGRGAKFRGEASGIYLYSADAAQGIRNYNPDARILLFLRGQEYFLPSLHHQLLYRFVDTIEDFETAWRMSRNRPPDTVPKTCPEPSVLNYEARGDFLTQVGRFLDAFPPDQILITDFDYWTKNPRSAYLRILDFLGLPDDGRRDFPRINEAKTYRIKWLGRLIAHPPRVVQAAVGLIRKITGRHALGIGAKASELLAAPGYKTHVPSELRAEIRKHYEGDNRQLKKRVADAGLDWGSA